MVFTYAHPPKEAFFQPNVEVNYFEVFCQLNGLEERCQAPWKEGLRDDLENLSHQVLNFIAFAWIFEKGLYR